MNVNDRYDLAFERDEEGIVVRVRRKPPTKISIVWVDLWLLLVTKHALRHWEVVRRLSVDLEWILGPRSSWVLRENDPMTGIYWKTEVAKLWAAKLWANAAGIVDEEHVRRVYEPVRFADHIQAMSGKGLREWLHL